VDVCVGREEADWNETRPIILVSVCDKEEQSPTTTSTSQHICARDGERYREYEASQWFRQDDHKQL